MGAKNDNKKIVAFSDNNNNKYWARVKKKIRIRTGNGEKEVDDVIEFDSYEDMWKYIQENVPILEETGKPSQYYYEINFVREYDVLDYRKGMEQDEDSCLTLYYYVDGATDRKIVHLPVDSRDKVTSIIKSSKNIPESVTNLDFYNEYYAHNEKFYEPPKPKAIGWLYTLLKPREPVVTRRKHYDYVPLPSVEIPSTKGKGSGLTVKRLVIFMTLMVSLFVGAAKAKKALIVSLNSNGGDSFMLDDAANNSDIDLYRNRAKVYDIINKLVKGETIDLTIDEVERVYSYLAKLERSNYDGNKSFNRFIMSDYKYAVRCDAYKAKQMADFIEDTDTKYIPCFRRSNPKDDNIVLQDEKGKKYLDWALSIILMNSSYYQQNLSQAYQPISSSNNNHATSAEIELFPLLPDILQLEFIERAQVMYSHMSNYSFSHPNYFGNVSNDLKKAKKECKGRIKMKLLYNSDAVINQAQSNGLVGYTNRGGK